MPQCTLTVGDLTVLVAPEGTPDVEYALFDPGEIQLLATGPGRNREVGYQTNIADARARLEDRGVTVALADEAAGAARPLIARAYARCAAVRWVADRLESTELFEGHTFDPVTASYAGAWLNLSALAADLDLPGVGGMMQAFYLAAILAERPADDVIVLTTADLASHLRPGERTYKRAVIENPGLLVPALRALRPEDSRALPDSGPGARALIEGLRARAARAPAARDRLAGLDALMTEREVPKRGPLADAELWAIETKLSHGDVADVAGQLDDVERKRGRLPGTIYLRGRVALMTRAEEPRQVAERMSELSTSMPAFHELELVAAQAWMAAGDARRAKAFARDLLDNATADGTIRQHARDVLRKVGSVVPAGSPASAAFSTQFPHIPGPPATPTGVQAGLPMEDRRPMTPSTRPLERPTWRAPGQEPPQPAYRVERSDPLREGYRSRPPGGSHPPTGTDETELLEELSLPAGMQGLVAPPLDEPPRTPGAARMAFTLLSRELARELRIRHSVELHSNLEGLELAQRFLHERFADGRSRTRDEERELLRHGAFVSELLARRLGARWLDLSAEEPGRWAMGIHAASRKDEIARVWPFARVLRFVIMGHKERDLVSYYLELEARTR